MPSYPSGRSWSKMPASRPIDLAPDSKGLSAASSVVAALVERARTAQAVAKGYDQAKVDEMVAAAGWAIVEPARNRELAERDDRTRKRHRADENTNERFDMVHQRFGARELHSGIQGDGKPH